VSPSENRAIALSPSCPEPGAAAEIAEALAWRLQLLEGENAVLALLARGAGMAPALDRLARLAETLFEGAACLVSLVDPARRTLAPIAGDEVPVAVAEALASVAIAQGTDPTSACVRRCEPVVVGELRADPSWGHLAPLALSAGVGGWWAHPVLDREGEAVAALSLVFARARSARSGELRAVDSLCALAAVVIEHHRRAEALQTAEHQFASLAANLPGVIYRRVVTSDGEIYYTYISEGARDLFGVSPEDVLADPNALFECHGPEYRETFRKNLIAASRELRMWDVEAQLVTRDGTVKWGHAIARPRAMADGSVVWDGIILDATRLKEANLGLAAANRAKTEFLANMSHELRTPLNAILGFSEIMRGEQFGPLGNPRYREYATDIHESGSHLLSVINDILDLARIEAGHLDLNEETVDPAALIDAGLRLVRERAEAHGIALATRIAPDLPAIRADERKLKQTLINLLSNAVKFTPDDGRVTVSVAASEAEGLTIVVSDTGIGIRAEDLPKVFDPFVQVDGGLARAYEGTGLGLPLSKAMVELHGGCLDLVSEPGAGTTATIRLPAERFLPASR